MPDIDPSTIVKVVTPVRRIARTLIQLVVGLAATIPAAAALFDLSAEQTAKVSGAMALAVAVLSVLQNLGEASGGTDTPALGVAVAPPTHPVD